MAFLVCSLFLSSLFFNEKIHDPTNILQFQGSNEIIKIKHGSRCLPHSCLLLIMEAIDSAEITLCSTMKISFPIPSDCLSS
jgi:hypothetical protein